VKEAIAMPIKVAENTRVTDSSPELAEILYTVTTVTRKGYSEWC
jgi:hypothetical protein